MWSQIVQFCSKCFSFRTQTFLCSPCALLPVDVFRVREYSWICLCTRVVQSTICVTRPAGRPFVDFWDSLGFLQTATHSELAVKKTKQAFWSSMNIIALARLFGADLIYIILNYNDSCCFSKFQWSQRIDGQQPLVPVTQVVQCRIIPGLLTTGSNLLAACCE